MTDEADRVNAAMADAIQSATSIAYPGDMVTRWVALVETIDPEGQRSLIMSCQQDLKPWDVLGMLQHATHLEQAATVAGHLDDDD